MDNQAASNAKLQSYFDFYTQLAPDNRSKIIQSCAAMFLYFGLLGISWIIPFPHLNFLGQYNSFFNWSSFVIAFSIYFYSTLSPLLSYMMLFLTLVFTCIISLFADNQDFTQINLIIFLSLMILAAFIRLLSIKIIGKNSIPKMEVFYMVIGPLWAMHFILKKFAIRF